MKRGHPRGPAPQGGAPWVETLVLTEKMPRFTVFTMVLGINSQTMQVYVMGGESPLKHPQKIHP